MGRYLKHTKKKSRFPVRILALLLPVVFVLVLSRAAFAKTTYVITDGDRVFTYETYATDPAQVLTEAGLELRAYDSYTAEDDSGKTALTIRRSYSVSVDAWGETMTAETQGETVGELLARLNIYPGEQDVLSHPADAHTYDGMEIAISREFTEEQIYTATIPYSTSYCYDDALPEGMEEVLTEGRDGEMRCTALVTYVNGEETDRRVTEQLVLTNPVEKVVAVGTGLKQDGEETRSGAIIGENTITLPSGEVLTYTSTAQVRATAYTHTDPGCDLITATGTTVRIGTVAVDPRYIPYGTRMFIVSNDGAYEYGISVAEDCGGAIKGDRVDLYYPTYSQCMDFGRRDCTIYFLG